MEQPTHARFLRQCSKYSDLLPLKLWPKLASNFMRGFLKGLRRVIKRRHGSSPCYIEKLEKDLIPSGGSAPRACTDLGGTVRGVAHLLPSKAFLQAECAPFFPLAHALGAGNFSAFFCPPYFLHFRQDPPSSRSRRSPH